MDKVIRKYTNFDALKTDEYRDWQKLPAHERMNAVVEITLAAYQMKEPTPEVPRLQRTLVHLRRQESKAAETQRPQAARVEPQSFPRKRESTRRLRK
jgi:hypothetical protein